MSQSGLKWRMERSKYGEGKLLEDVEESEDFQALQVQESSVSKQIK